MKYFSPSYWFKLWVLSAPLFNDQTKGINAKSIDNKNNKNWDGKNTTNISILENLTSNNQTTDFEKYLSISSEYLDLQKLDKNLYTKLLELISYQRYEKIINRYKRQNNNLNLPNVRQIHASYCGPAIAEAILRYYGINIPITPGVNMQIELANRMNTIPLPGSGTTPTNWRDTINNILQAYNLRRYSVYRVNVSNQQWIRARFFNIVSQTLESNMPFPVAYTGHLIFNDNNDANFNEERPDDQHFILITGARTIPRTVREGIITRHFGNHIYTIMDPWTGQFREIEEYHFYNMFSSRRDSYWIYDSAINIDEQMEWQPNDDAEMDMQFGQSNLIASFAACNLIINKRNPQKRETQNNSKDKICELKTEFSKIKGTTKTIKIINDYTKDKNTKAGDLYIGTDKGLYLVHFTGKVFKADNIDDAEITSIKNFNRNKFYVSTNKSKVYVLNTDFIINSNILIGQILSNIESSDLNKELLLYYNKDHQNQQLDLNPTIGNYYNTKSFLLNLNKISPVDNYEKIQFLGDIDSNCWGTMVNWGGWVYTNDCDASWGNVKKWRGYNIKKFLEEKNNRFHDIVENTKNQVSTNKEQILQKFSDNDSSAKLEVNQRFGLTWYWENDNYFLKVFGLQYCEWWASYASLDCHLKMGNGIKLYNDDVQTNIIFSNSSQFTSQEAAAKTELVNLTSLSTIHKNLNVTSTTLPSSESTTKVNSQNTIQWDKNITDLVNHEQYLQITNNTNLIKNNITSL